MNRLNGRGDCDEKIIIIIIIIIIRVTGMVRLSRETWVTKAIGVTRTTRVMR